MGEKSAISWTDATFNCWWGCWPVSPGCALCYAAREAERYGWSDSGASGPDLWKEKGPRRTFGEKHWNAPRKWARELPAELGRRPRVFCASMADIGEDHPTADRERPKLWQLIEETPQLDWLLLTKRVSTARQWLPERWLRPGGWPAHAWFGFSAERQKEFDERWPYARDIPAAIRFCSYEPALGPINFSEALWRPMDISEIPGWAMNDGCGSGIARTGALHWIISGGESGGSKVRLTNPGWVRSAKDQAVAAGAAFHHKQWGEWADYDQLPSVSGWEFVRERNGKRYGRLTHNDEVNDGFAFDGRLFETRYPWNTPENTGPCMVRVGKPRAGRLLDGREWNEFPEVSPRV